jgi:hypothetical protein
MTRIQTRIFFMRGTGSAAGGNGAFYVLRDLFRGGRWVEPERIELSGAAA